MIKTKIEWCDSTWNPVTGCCHECPYCYAERTATRFKGCDESPNGDTEEAIVELEARRMFTAKDGREMNASYPYGFKPTLHKYRLGDLDTKKFGETIFVCSTADLFGSWVPDEWIDHVFHSCLRHDEHRYMFLTKNPERYYALKQKGELPNNDNFWYGTTVTTPDSEYFFSEEHHTFLSIEPILECFKGCGDNISKTELVIVGAETGKRIGKVVPQKEWVYPIVNVCKDNGIPLFFKDSMKPIWGEDIPTELPWRKV